MFNTITIIIVVVLGVVGYVLRRNFRRSWHVFRTGDEHPDTESTLSFKLAEPLTVKM